MAIPDYQSLMLPLLEYAGDSKEHQFSDACDFLAEQFGVSDEERLTLLPSGRYPLFRNRVGWAKTYITKAGLLESTGRGLFVITKRGRKVLDSGIEKIDTKFLREFPEFLEFQNKGSKKTSKKAVSSEERIDPPKDEKTPDEMLETAFESIHSSLADELLEQIGACSSIFFEKIVIDLLVAMGYGGTVEEAGEQVGQSGDEGIDGIIKEDRLGLDVIYIQAKKWDKNSSVSRPEIQKFVGALQGKHARKGVFITTANFSKPAQMYVRNLSSKVVLIDGEQLAKYMIDFNIGVSLRTTYEVKKINSDYFFEG